MKSRVIKISCLMIATVLVAISFFAIFKVCWNARNKNKETEIVEVAAIDGYDLANAEHKGDGVYQIPRSDYKNNTNFLINNYAGLYAFTGVVGSGNRDFSGKNVYLTSDIDCNGKSITVGFTYVVSSRVFKGNLFDGQFHTISNFKINDHYRLETSSSSTKWQALCSYGFFTYLGENTEIRNLRLKNYEIVVSRGKGHADWYNLPEDELWTDLKESYAVGGLVGYLNGSNKIYNCVVENFTCSKTSAGLIGAFGNGVNDANVYNCLVNNSNVSRGIVGNGADASDFGSIPVTAYLNIKDCIVNSTLGSVAISPSSQVKSNGVYINSSTDEEISNISSLIWYKGGDDYNDGFPYLRQFLDWQTINFVAGEGGSVSPSSMEIPSDAESSKVSRLNNTTERMPLYFNYMIYATPNANYDFTKWTWNSSTKTYTANFKRREVTVRIIENDNATLSVNPSRESREYTVYAGTTITIEMQQSYSDGNKYRKVYITFNYEKGSSTYVAHIYYEADSSHYISDTNVGTTGSFTVTDDVEISVNVELKTYDVIFK